MISFGLARATNAQRPLESDNVAPNRQQQQPRPRLRPRQRRKWPRPCSRQATPRAQIQPTSGIGRLGRKLVPLIIVQFVINCLLASILNSDNSLNKSPLLSQASPIEGMRLVANNKAATMHKHNQKASGGNLVEAFRRQDNDQDRDPKSTTQSVRETIDQADHHHLNEPSRRASLISDVIRRRPRWRLSPLAILSATRSLGQNERGAQQPAITLIRHNKLLTIEEVTEVNEEATELNLGRVDSFDSELMQHSEQHSTAATMTVSERPVRSRRHQELQQASSTLATTPNAIANLSDRQRQHVKTRLEIADARQTYRNKLIELKQRYLTNRAITDRAYYILLIIYAILITFGTISNSLICLTVIFKPKILSPRNLFIVNLAGSDLLLCIFTMPLTFIELSMKIWQMGLIPCKLVAGLQATSIFVSTISITAIALDRYKVIVYPTHQETASGTRGALLLLASVWIGALSLSLPLFTYRTVEHHEITSTHNQSDPFQVRSSDSILDPVQTVASQSASSSSLSSPLDYNSNHLDHSKSSSTSQAPTTFRRYPNQLVDSFDFCIESWPFSHGRGIFSVISMVLQYVLPITIVSFVYTKISRKLQKRLIRRQRLTQLECQQKRQLNLIKRTHTMLVSVSLVFGFSWLPLNLWNMASDFSADFRHLFDDQTFRIIFAVCHLIGCSSACSNPILYGFLNENFRKEFHQVWNYQARVTLRRLRRLLDWLNCCWLTRKLFACCSCGNQINFRDEEEEEGDDDEDKDLETDRPVKAAANASKRHGNRQLVQMSPSSCANEHDKRLREAGGLLSSRTSDSSNYFTDDDGQSSSFLSGYTSNAHYSDDDHDHDEDDPSTSSSLAGRCKLRVGSRHLANVNAIPLSLLSLNIDDSARTANHLREINYANQQADQDHGGARLDQRTQPFAAARLRADSTPCRNRKRTLQAPGGATRATLARAKSTNSGQLAREKQATSETALARTGKSIRQNPNQMVQVVMSDGDEQSARGFDGAASSRLADNEEKRRRFSYQTIISSNRTGGHQQTLGGRAMRLCLCISSSSSAETIGGPASSVAVSATAADKLAAVSPNGIEQPIMMTNIGGGLGGHNSPLARQNGNSTRGLNRSDDCDRVNLKAPLAAEESRRDRRRRARRRQRQQQQQMRLTQPAQLECECQCHRAGCSETAVIVAEAKAATGNVQPAEYDTRSLCDQPPPPYTSATLTTANDDDDVKGEKDGAQRQATFAGRRVWLRFLGAGHEWTPPTTMINGVENEFASGLDKSRRCLAPNSNGGQVPKQHRSQPDLMRLAEHKGVGGSQAVAAASADSLALCLDTSAGNNNDRLLKPTHERNQSSGTFDDTSGRQPHCNNCKHSSVPSEPAKMPPPPLASATSRLQRRQQRRLRGASLARRRHKQEGARRNIISESLARLSNQTTRETTMKTMNVADSSAGHHGVTATATAPAAAPPSGHKRSRPLSSISSWVSGLRHRKSFSSKEAGQQHQQQSSSCSIGGSGTLARGSSGQLARQRSGGGSSNSGLRQKSTAIGQGGAKPKSSSSATSVAFNSQNHTPNLMTGSGPVPYASGATTTMRNNLQQLQTASSIKVANSLGTSPQVALLDPSEAPHARQVGTVYLSIETTDRDRADSVFSFDGAREKSTSVVVMLADDDDKEDDDEGECNQVQQSRGGGGDQSLGRNDAQQPDHDETTVRSNDISKVTTVNLELGDELDSNELHQSRDTIANGDDGERCQGRTAAAASRSPPPAGASEPNTERAISPRCASNANRINNNASDQLLDGKDSSAKLPAGKLMATETICALSRCPNRADQAIPAADTCERTAIRTPTRDSKFIDCWPGAPNQKSPAPLSGEPLAGGHHDACQSNNNRRPTSLSQAAAPASNEVELPAPLAINSSGSSGSISPSALSFTSACLLQHSSSISSCTCSLTASSFSSGQLNATTTTATSTTQESSLSTSCQTTAAAGACQSAGNSMQCHWDNQQHHLDVASGGVLMLLNQQQQQKPTSSINASSMPTPSETIGLKFDADELEQAGDLRLSNSLACQRSAGGVCGRQVAGGQRPLQLRQTRTHSATMGSDSGRSLMAVAAGAALAAAQAQNNSNGRDEDLEQDDYTATVISLRTTSTEAAAGNHLSASAGVGPETVADEADEWCRGPDASSPLHKTPTSSAAETRLRGQVVVSTDNNNCLLQTMRQTNQDNNKFSPTRGASELAGIEGELMMMMAAEVDRDADDDRNRQERQN